MNRKNSSTAAFTDRRAGDHLRLQVWYVVLVLIFSIFIGRLFYIQVIKHDYYRKQALNGQLREYTIAPERGVIEAQSGSDIVPIVLNEKLYTLFADPKYITNAGEYSKQLSSVTHANPTEYQKKISQKNTRYVVLAKKLSKADHEKIDALRLKGIGTREETYRTYPQNSLASQVLGFVDGDGNGRYGIEESLDKELRGSSGLLKAITDASGVPLVANKNNIQKDPIAGDKVVLTIDITMQRQLEDILKQGLDNAKSSSGSALILDPNSGAIKAVANYPTYNPSEYNKVANAADFSNAAFSSPLEPGSVMKTLTSAAAMEQGLVTPATTYYDPSYVTIDGATIKNVAEDGGAAVRSVRDILQYSLNTGAVWMLQQMGGGEINSKARQTWFDYMSNHYQFGKKTGVEGYEAVGIVPDPNSGDGLNIRFANSSFGQGVTVTPLQFGAALSAVVNGGVYYRPHLVEKTISPEGIEKIKKPEVVNAHVVSEQVSASEREMMQFLVNTNYQAASRPGYNVGGKTGTAQISKQSGGYYDDRYNGTFVGFVGGDKPDYVIVIRVNEPHISGFAGIRAAAPIFASTSNMLIDSFGVTPATTSP